MIKTRTYFQCFVWFTTTMNLYVWILSFQLCLCVPSDNKDRLSPFWVCLVLFVCLFHSDLFYFHYNDYRTGLSGLLQHFLPHSALPELLVFKMVNKLTIWDGVDWYVNIKYMSYISIWYIQGVLNKVIKRSWLCWET